jgi:hypothetical protein
MTARNVPSFKSTAPQSGNGAIFRSLDHAKRGVTLLHGAAVLHYQALPNDISYRRHGFDPKRRIVLGRLQCGGEWALQLPEIVYDRRQCVTGILPCILYRLTLSG